jgi:hypothetical protein
MRREDDVVQNIRLALAGKVQGAMQLGISTGSSIHLKTSVFYIIQP